MIRHRRVAQREPRNAPHGRSFCAIALALSCASSAAASPAPSRSARLADEFRAGVEVLAADSMEGRGLTTAGILRAANWKRELRSRGLKPAFENSYRQPFDIKTGVVPLSGNHLEGVPDPAWVPLGFSSAGAFSGEIAFLGYGIDAPPLAFSEFDGADVLSLIHI